MRSNCAWALGARAAPCPLNPTRLYLLLSTNLLNASFPNGRKHVALEKSGELPYASFLIPVAPYGTGRRRRAYPICDLEQMRWTSSVRSGQLELNIVRIAECQDLRPEIAP